MYDGGVGFVVDISTELKNVQMNRKRIFGNVCVALCSVCVASMSSVDDGKKDGHAFSGAAERRSLLIKTFVSVSAVSTRVC